MDQPHLGIMKKTICSFGELLLRFSPEMQGGFIREAQMPVYIGGAELNLAQALALWGEDIRYVTALPKNYLAEEIVSFISEKNIDTRFIHYGGERIGTYYLPQGKDLKHNAVIYDRAHSSFSALTTGILNWDEILDGVQWFHFSAISPALNESVAATCLEAVKAAKEKGIRISVDLNYRSKLWQYGKSPATVMPELIQYCDLVMGNIWAANSLLAIPVTLAESKGKTRDELSAAAFESMALLKEKFPGIQTMSYTFRLDENYFACLQYEDTNIISRNYALKTLKDKVGSGDCFMAGLLYGCVHENPAQDIIDFAAAAAVLKLSQTGDATSSLLTDIQKAMKDHE
jgi:2-dehydro-3-deoxygluconokinase